MSSVIAFSDVSMEDYSSDDTWDLFTYDVSDVQDNEHPVFLNYCKRDFYTDITRVEKSLDYLRQNLCKQNVGYITLAMHIDLFNKGEIQAIAVSSIYNHIIIPCPEVFAKSLGISLCSFLEYRTKCEYPYWN